LTGIVGFARLFPGCFDRQLGWRGKGGYTNRRPFFFFHSSQFELVQQPGFFEKPGFFFDVGSDRLLIEFCLSHGYD
jgi:hypothetical protein